MTDSESSGSHRRVREVFLRALEFSVPTERERYLDSACGDDPSLRSEVEGLLRVSGDAESFLHKSAMSDALPGLEDMIGSMIGRYRIVEKLGEGGFGEVYRAEQIESLHREVAVKIIKPGMDSLEVIARFEGERQALALMDHQGIASVLDAGTTDLGRPYFVMELACGVPITEYCDSERLTIDQRLELFRSVCSAVQHAHQRGIIHRDLKPSNIVVVTVDGRPCPKIIDFGIAKSLESRLTERTMVTRPDSVVGTPAYMSPEQFEGGSETVDTRSDIYSLGVVLYELLVGDTPYGRDRLKQAGFDQVRRILQVDNPTKPSQAVHSIDGRIANVAEARRCDPPAWAKALRGDLDWITLRAIERPASRRYQSCGELARDIERHLHHVPVEASPPSRLYRARKFVRRHQAGVALAGLGTVFVVSALVVALLNLARANAERDRARIEELMAQVESIQSTTLRSMLVPMVGDSEGIGEYALVRDTAGTGDEIRTQRAAVDLLSHRVDTVLQDHPDLEISARKTLVECYFNLGLNEAACEQLKRISGSIKAAHGSEDERYADSLVDYATAVLRDVEQTAESDRGNTVDSPSRAEKMRIAERTMNDAAGIYRTGKVISLSRLSVLQFIASRTDAGVRAPILEEIASVEEALPETLGLDLDRVGAHRIAVEDRAGRRYSDGSDTVSIRDGMFGSDSQTNTVLSANRVDQVGRTETLYRETIRQIETDDQKLRRDYEGFLRSLVALLEQSGRSDPSVEAKLAEMAYVDLFESFPCVAEYRIAIQTPGRYQLFLRWDGYNDRSNAIGARIAELRDGVRGDIADVWGFVIPSDAADADFETVAVWQGTGYMEAIDPVHSELRSAIWNISTPGVYTLQFVGPKAGAALDAFVFQLDSQEPPKEKGPDRTPLNDDGTFMEVDGFVAVEAENVSLRIPGLSAEWVIVPDEGTCRVSFNNPTGGTYLQVLPDDTLFDPIELITNRAWVAESEWRWDDAIALYSDGLAQDPNRYAFLMGRGRAREKLHDFRSAATDYQRAASIADDPIDAMVLRADCLIRLDSYDEVIKELSAVVPESTQNSEAVSRLALALNRVGRTAEAVNMVTAAIERQPGSSELWVARGDIQTGQGNYGTAAADFVRAIEIDPMKIWRYGRLVTLHLSGTGLETIEFGRIMRGMPVPGGTTPSLTHARYLFISSLGPDVMARTGDIVDVANCVLEGLNANDTWGGSIRAQLVGGALYRAGETEKAIELLLQSQEDSSINWGPYRSHFVFLLSMAYSDMERSNRARFWYDRAVTILENDEQALTHNEDPARPRSWDARANIVNLRREAADKLGLAHKVANVAESQSPNSPLGVDF